MRCCSRFRAPKIAETRTEETMKNTVWRSVGFFLLLSIFLSLLAFGIQGGDLEFIQLESSTL